MSKGSRKQAAGEVEAPAAETAAPVDGWGREAEIEQRHRAKVEQLEARLAVLEQQVEKLRAHLNLQATLSTEQVLAALDDDQRAEFVVAAPFRAGVVSLAAGQVVSNATHDLRQLARAGAPLNRAA